MRYQTFILNFVDSKPKEQKNFFCLNVTRDTYVHYQKFLNFSTELENYRILWLPTWFKRHPLVSFLKEDRDIARVNNRWSFLQWHNLPSEGKINIINNTTTQSKYFYFTFKNNIKLVQFLSFKSNKSLYQLIAQSNGKEIRLPILWLQVQNPMNRKNFFCLNTTTTTYVHYKKVFLNFPLK